MWFDRCKFVDCINYSHNNVLSTLSSIEEKMTDADMFIHEIEVFVMGNTKIVEEMEKQLDKPSSAGVILRVLQNKLDKYYGRKN